MKSEYKDIEDVAIYFLNYFFKKGLQINHLKLQKILYYFQAWHLVYFKSPFFEDVPEAWVNGPVYRKIYNIFKEWKLYENFRVLEKYIPQFEILFNDAEKKLSLSPEQLEFIDSLIIHYGTMTPDRLVMLTHSEGPWCDARNGLGLFEYSQQKISHESMENYYRNRIESKAN